MLSRFRNANRTSPADRLRDRITELEETDDAIRSGLAIILKSQLQQYPSEKIQLGNDRNIAVSIPTSHATGMCIGPFQFGRQKVVASTPLGRRIAFTRNTWLRGIGLGFYNVQVEADCANESVRLQSVAPKTVRYDIDRTLDKYTTQEHIPTFLGKVRFSDSWQMLGRKSKPEPSSNFDDLIDLLELRQR